MFREKKEREDCHRWPLHRRSLHVQLQLRLHHPAARQTGSLFCSLPVLPVFKDFTKGDKFLRFCHKTCSIPTKKEEGARHVPRTCGPHPRRLSGQELLPKTASSMRPSSWIPPDFVRTVCPKIHHESNITYSTDVTITL